MKIAHSVIITPGACGLYETTREVVAALRASGIDSRMVDPTGERNALHPKGDEDRGAPIERGFGWALDADIIVNHSGYDGTPLETSSIPVIHVAHGRPRHSFNSERNGGAPVLSYLYHRNQDPRCKAVVTFWPEHVPYLKVLFPDRPVCFVPSPVDLDAWKPGPATFDFGGKGGAVNVVHADAWRDDVDPYEAIMGFALWARGREGARLHLYGSNEHKARGWQVLLKRLQDDGTLGQVAGRVTQDSLRAIYRSADVLLTPNRIDTRTVREAMACGLPVARACHGITMTGNLLDQAIGQDRGCVRKSAEQRFGADATAAAFRKVLESHVAMVARAA